MYHMIEGSVVSEVLRIGFRSEDTRPLMVSISRIKFCGRPKVEIY